jgi:hypothetical protein
MKISDLCSLIKSCSDAGVKEFQLGDLRITFDINNLTTDKQDPNNSTRSVPFYTTQEAVDLGMDREDELTQLMLKDPVAYDEMVDTK